MRPILLDTHIWVWLMEGAEREIGSACRKTIQTASVESVLVISVMSVWEVAMLEVRARIQLSLDCRAWVDKALTAPGTRLQALTPAIAVESTRLPSIKNSCFIRTPIGSRLRLRLRSRNFATLLNNHLPQELQTELNLTGRDSVGCAGDHARTAIVISTVINETQARQSEVRMVCNVEEFGAELNSELL